MTTDHTAAIDLVEEVLTITTSRVGITDSLLVSGTSPNPVNPRNILRVRFQHVSGDPIYHSVINGVTPSLTGANGEDYSIAGASWIIKGGSEKLTDWGAIVESGGVTARVKVTLMGRE